MTPSNSLKMEMQMIKYSIYFAGALVVALSIYFLMNFYSNNSDKPSNLDEIRKLGDNAPHKNVSSRLCYRAIQREKDTIGDRFVNSFYLNKMSKLDKLQRLKSTRISV